MGQIHPTAIIDSNASVSNSATIWHFCHIRKNAIIEDNVSLGRDCYIDEDVIVAKGSRIQNGVSIYKGVIIEPYVFVGPHVIFTNDQFPRVGNKNWKISKTKLKSGCSIGAGAIIRCGIEIGNFAMVGAGSIVTKSISPFSLVMGTPSREVSHICACGQTMISLKSFQDSFVLDCCNQNLEQEVLVLAKEIDKRKLYEEMILK